MLQRTETSTCCVALVRLAEQYTRNCYTTCKCERWTKTLSVQCVTNLDSIPLGKGRVSERTDFDLMRNICSTDGATLEEPSWDLSAVRIN